MTKPRILLVEDDESHRLTLARHLRREEYDVLAVEDALQALNQVGAFEPHVVITDVQMPEMSGFELLRRLRDSTPDVDVVVVTGFAGIQGAIDAMKDGAYDYLVKPIDLNQLDEILSRCLSVQESTEETGAAPGTLQGTAGGLVGRDPVMMELYKTVGTLAASRAAVLIRGETGTGKELVARAIHENSKHAAQPFVPVNCAAVPDSLLESELFGHVRGAFTGAASDRRGRFELAGEGTIFLDEIGDTSLAFQAKLLRVLQEREFYRVGGEELLSTRARVIAATHQPLEELVRQGDFREDLYFRLRVVEVAVPPMRERRSDIPLLVSHLLARAGEELGRPVPVVPPAVLAELVARDWPGNVRELENVLTRAVALCRGPALTLQDVGGSQGGGFVGEVLEVPDDGDTDAESTASSLESLERRYVQRVLMQTGGNKSATARILDISRPRLDRMIDRHRLVT